jgi:hypothetical protein
MYETPTMPMYGVVAVPICAGYHTENQPAIITSNGWAVLFIFFLLPAMATRVNRD